MIDWGRSSLTSACSNLVSSSSLPIALAAWAIWRSSSCSRRNARMIEPSNTSVSWQRSAKRAPWHHCSTASISSTLKLCTYSCSTTGSWLSTDTCAIRRAVSCSTRRGAVISSRKRDGCSLFSPKTKHESSAAHCSGVRSLKVPLNMSSVSKSSSPVLISHATRPFFSTMSSADVKPRRRSTRLRHLSSSSCSTLCAAVICAWMAATWSCAACLAA